MTRAFDKAAVDDLLTNVLAQAIKDYRQVKSLSQDHYISKINQVKNININGNNAYRWLTSEGCFSICDYLKIDYEFLMDRLKIKGWGQK